MAGFRRDKPIDRFLFLLLYGWRLPFVVEPMEGHHGDYSILLTRGEFDHG